MCSRSRNVPEVWRKNGYGNNNNSDNQNRWDRAQHKDTTSAEAGICFRGKSHLLLWWARASPCLWGAGRRRRWEGQRWLSTLAARPGCAWVKGKAQCHGVHIGKSNGALFPVCSSGAMAAMAFVNLTGVNTLADTPMLCSKHHVRFGPVQLGGLWGDRKDHLWFKTGQPQTTATCGGPGFVACRWMVWKYGSKRERTSVLSLLLGSQPGFGGWCSWR